VRSPVLSIIVPTLNEADGIADTLLPLQGLRRGNCEIIVADGGSTDNTLELVFPLVDHITLCAAGRAKQMNTAALKARGDYLLFLHADTQLPEDFEALFLAAIVKHRLWGFFAVSLSGRHWLLRVVETLMNWRSKLSGIGTGDQSIWVQRELFNDIGGFVDMPLMEDVELCKRLKKKAKPLRVNFSVRTSSQRWEEHGILKTILLMWCLRLAYFLGASSQQLVKLYYPHYKVAPKSDYLFPNYQLIQFSKTLQLGKVKTRLRPALGDEGCLQLHKQLLQHCFQVLEQSQLAAVSIELAGDQSPQQLTFFRQLAPDHEITSQQGVNLGQRMYHAAACRLAAKTGVVIVGSDCPFFTTEYLTEALQKLAAGIDCVLGPAADGGYVLIGLRRASMGLFDGIEWGSDRVLQQTIERLDRLQWSYHLLPELADIDRPEDISLLTKSFHLNFARETPSVVA
jgi:rSAM/selenodomain-associated transferase 2/rSAM/selenodomain-associated transferase 1